jgi:hypothetical protein
MIKSAKRESMKRSRAAKKAAAEVHNVVDSTPAGGPATDTPAHEASTSDGKPSKPRRGLKAPKAAETGEPRDLSVELAANPPAEASGEARKATMGTLGNAGASNAGEATAASQAAPSAEVRKVITDAVGDFGAGAIARVMAVTNLQVLPRKDLQLIVDHGAANELAELIEQLRRVGAEFFAWADKLAKIEPEKEEPEAQTAEAALVQAINKVAKAEEGWWLEQAEHPVDGEIAWVRHDGILPPGPLLWRLVDLFELAAGFELDAETIVTAVKAAEVNGARQHGGEPKPVAAATKADRMAAARAAKKARKDTFKAALAEACQQMDAKKAAAKAEPGDEAVVIKVEPKPENASKAPDASKAPELEFSDIPVSENHLTGYEAEVGDIHSFRVEPLDLERWRAVLKPEYEVVADDCCGRGEAERAAQQYYDRHPKLWPATTAAVEKPKFEVPADLSLPDFLKRVPDDFDKNAAAAVAGKRQLH